MKYVSKSRKLIILFFFFFFLPLFICHAVCFAKMNIPTELTPIWQCWHEADGCISYVERCYCRLTVKICYLNRVACWRRVACRLLWVYTCESDCVKATDIKLRMSNCLIQECTVDLKRNIFSPSRGLYNFKYCKSKWRGNLTGTVLRAFQLNSISSFSVMCTVLKKWCSCKGRGNRPPTDPLFAS